MAYEQQAVEGEPSRLFLAASYFVLLVGGGLLGLVGAFLLPYSVSSAYAAPAPASGPGGAAHVLASGTAGGLGTLLSVGLLVAIVANPALSMAGLWMAGTRLAAVTPLIGWLVVVLPLGSVTTDGNNVLPGTLRSAAFLLLGILAFTAVAVLSRPTRGMTAFNNQSLLAAGRPQPPPVRPVRTRAPKKSSAARTAPKGGKRR